MQLPTQHLALALFIVALIAAYVQLRPSAAPIFQHRRMPSPQRCPRNLPVKCCRTLKVLQATPIWPNYRMVALPLRGSAAKTTSTSSASASLTGMAGGRRSRLPTAKVQRAAPSPMSAKSASRFSTPKAPGCICGTSAARWGHRSITASLPMAARAGPRRHACRPRRSPTLAVTFARRR